MKKNCHRAYQEWLRVILKQMSHLSKPQAVVLGMWSFAIAMTHFCGLSTVSVFLAEILEQPENTVRERLRQWYLDGGEKKGRKRGQIDVEQSFVPLLSWILSWWSSSEKSLVLAADASTLGQRFTLLVISVVYRGCGIPVAWKIVPATEKGSWKPHWLKLLEKLKDGLPEDWWVIVTTDRGLYAPWLYQAIQELGWHHTKMTDPQRAERLWLAIAVATLYLVSIGGQAEVNLPASSLPPLSEITSDAETEENLISNSGESSLEDSQSAHSNSTRLLSCFRRGFLSILASVIKGMPLPRGRFLPDFSPAPG